MKTEADNRVLTVTRGLIYLMMGLVAFAGVVLALVSVGLPFGWDQAVSGIREEYPKINPEGLLSMIYAIFAIALVLLGLAWTVLRKLMEIVRTVSEGDPFVRANAVRLKAIGWLMSAGYIVSFPLAIVAEKVADRFGDNDVGVDFSLTSVLAILLAFVLAGVFEQGAALREEMEGTV